MENPPKQIAFLREPLLHFLILGGVIFAFFFVTDDTPPPLAVNRIEVTASDATRIAAQFEATRNREPTDSELSALIDHYIEEEILVREARALGLDRGDTVVRQRLVLKMRFLMESAAEAAETSDAALATHLEAHPKRFARPARMAFAQVPVDASNVTNVLADLKKGAAPEGLGVPSLLPVEMPLSPSQAIDATFGTGFSDKVAALEPGRWGGPVQSSYGLHLVRLSTLEPRSIPALEDIRQSVERDWRSELRASLAEERLAKLTSGYEIQRADAVVSEQK